MSWVLAIVTPSTSPSPATSGIDWQDILKTVAAVVTAAVAVIGGGFAYAKFLRGRTFQPVALLTLVAAELQVWGQSALRVDVSIKNGGSPRFAWTRLTHSESTFSWQVRRLGRLPRSAQTGRSCGTPEETLTGQSTSSSNLACCHTRCPDTVTLN